MTIDIKGEKQLALEEHRIDSDELVKVLDAYMKKKDEIDAINEDDIDEHGNVTEKGCKTLKKEWRAMLDGMELGPDQLHRCGPYRIKVKRVPEKEVKFTQSARVTFEIEEAG